MGSLRRKGMCPVCYAKLLKGLATPSEYAIPAFYNNEQVDNGMALTPPMGWSTWNTFQYGIDQDLILETAKAFKEKGLIEAGYTYLNIDDCWQDKVRNEKGELCGDPVRFPDGMKALVEKVNALGIKLGIYTDNGTMTCCDYPGTFGHYYRDAYTFAKWGIEYWKVDYCHSVEYSYCAPRVTGIVVSQKGKKLASYGVEEGKRRHCRVFKIKWPKTSYMKKTTPFTHYAYGIDANHGRIEFFHSAQEEGEYVITVHMTEKNGYEKFLGVLVNNERLYTATIPAKRIWLENYELNFIVRLRQGENSIQLFNPIKNKATCDMLQYQEIYRAVMQATADYAEETGQPEKKIVFSICEGNQANPHLWGKSAGNLWRTTCDIKENWKSILHNYEHNVQIYEYACPGHWNDPDMLEVGVGDLTYKESEAHFIVWCMMASPLILGNDIRVMSDEIKDLVTNKELIAVDQDKLGKQCIRVQKGDVDILAKPLEDGKTAVCIFNKVDGKRSYRIDEEALAQEKYLSYVSSDVVRDPVEKADKKLSDVIEGEIEGRSAKVYIIGKR